MLFLKSHCKKRTKPQMKLEADNRAMNTLVEDPSLQQLAEIAFQLDGTLSQATEQSTSGGGILENVVPIVDKRDAIKNEYFNQSRLQYSSPTSSGLPMVTTIGTNTEDDVYVEQQPHCEQQTDYEMPNKKAKLSGDVQDAVQETVDSMLETFKNRIVEQSTPAATPISPTKIQTVASSSATAMLDHFSQFVASSLTDISAKKRNDAIGHITNYLITIRNEENI